LGIEREATGDTHRLAAGHTDAIQVAKQVEDDEETVR
jgi:hypothetical protein